jgi:hypothetical protein
MLYFTPNDDLGPVKKKDDDLDGALDRGALDIFTCSTTPLPQSYAQYMFFDKDTHNMYI